MTMLSVLGSEPTKEEFETLLKQFENVTANFWVSDTLGMSDKTLNRIQEKQDESRRKLLEFIEYLLEKANA